MGGALTYWLSGVIGPAFGVATLAVVTLTYLRMGRGHPAFHLALMLLTFWIIAQLLGPEIDPMIDTLGFYTALSVWFARRGRDWALVLAGLFGLQLITHFFFADSASVLRMAVLNVLFAAQLMVVCEPCVPEPLRRHFRGLLGFGPPSRAARLARTRQT